jgi:serine protease Do
MMPNRVRLLVITACVLLCSAASASAQSSLSDRGKKRLPRLFAEAVSSAAESTVRVECDGKEAALGTIVSEDGYILTKGSELRGTITCILWDGRAYDAEQVGYDRASDLALLKIDARRLKPVAFADVKAAEVGNWVAAVGPSSEPIAVGVISAGPRKLDPRTEEGQITNLNKGALGIRMRDPLEGEGVEIERVEPGTAAARAGLRAGDLIVELAGKEVKTRESLIQILENYKPNDTVVARIIRDGKELEIKVKLGSRSDFDRSSFQNAMGGPLSDRRTGFPVVIQHDTVIRPTDCGGPLVDLDGRVLGINIARAGRVETWALPGDVVEKVLKELRTAKATTVSK